MTTKGVIIQPIRDGAPVGPQIVSLDTWRKKFYKLGQSWGLWGFGFFCGFIAGGAYLG